MEGIKKSKSEMTVNRALVRLAGAALSTKHVWTSELSQELNLMNDKYNLNDDQATVVAVVYIKPQAPKEQLLKVMYDMYPRDRTVEPRFNLLVQRGILFQNPKNRV